MGRVPEDAPSIGLEVIVNLEGHLCYVRENIAFLKSSENNTPNSN